MRTDECYICSGEHLYKSSMFKLNFNYTYNSKVTTVDQKFSQKNMARFFFSANLFPCGQHGLIVLLQAAAAWTEKDHAATSTAANL